MTIETTSADSPPHSKLPMAITVIKCPLSLDNANIMDTFTIDADNVILDKEGGVLNGCNDQPSLNSSVCKQGEGKERCDKDKLEQQLDDGLEKQNGPNLNETLCTTHLIITPPRPMDCLLANDED